MVLDHFKNISRIPRGSRNNKAISNYLVDFAKEHGLRYIQDDSLNVVIYKDASPGYEQCEPLVFQGHMDMVCEKIQGSTHDFLTEGIVIIEEDGFLRADGTTLGGDDGIAIAYMLEYLTDETLVHPPFEMVITTDEEIGMCGAKEFDASVLKGRRMINIDSEEEGIFTVSCAGGLIGETNISINREELNGIRYDIVLGGLRGGHSGIDIAKNRWNAVITLGRLISMIDEAMNNNSGSYHFGIIGMSGGSKDNVIPSEATLSVACEAEYDDQFREAIDKAINIIKSECITAEPDVSFIIKRNKGLGNEEIDKYSVIDHAAMEKLITLLKLVPCGVQVMSAGIEGMVESSCNLGIFDCGDDNIRAVVSMRSSKGSYIEYMDDKLKGLADLLGGDFKNYGGYPGWDMKPESHFRDIMCEVYRDTFGKDAVVEGVHAGLEGGLFVEKIPDMDIVSIGPDMYDIHTSKERIDIASVERVDRFLRNVIERLVR